MVRGRSREEEHAGVVSLIDLCGGTWVEISGRELMRLIGAGTLP